MAHKTTIYTLNIDNYAPEIRAVCRPTVDKWANKIGAEVVEITERKYPTYPVVYEKLQIKEIEKQRQSDWIIFIDADALIHPDMFDLTTVLPQDTVMFHGKDFSPNRFVPDDVNRRDGRWIGACNWLAVASKWNLDLWTELDLSLEEVERRIHPVAFETDKKMSPLHLIDDFTLTRNIAKFGLKHTTFFDIVRSIGQGPNGQYFFHLYNIPETEKLEKLKEKLEEWNKFE